MPRKLPWLQGNSTTTTKRPAAAARTTPKRQRVEPSTPASDEDDAAASSRKGKASARSRAPSTSPPPAPPTESTMEEGKEHDDKYRMVEDEFLGVAQQFTVHLHTAEYKRREKLVKDEKSDAIKSISRPVTGKMPDQTRRKVEGIKRAKAQKHAVADVLSKKPYENTKDSDDSDGDGDVDLPYVGTTLHGLMDSPRRKATTLGKAGTFAIPSRAAAGYKKSSALLRSSQMSPSVSPTIKRHGRPTAVQDDLTASSDDEDDDDLGAPIRAPISTLKLAPPKLTPKDSTTSKSQPILPTAQPTKSGRSISVPSSGSTMKEPVPIQKSSSRVASSESKPVPVTTTDKPRISRIDYARRQKAKEEAEAQKKKAAVIPTFLF